MRALAVIAIFLVALPNSLASQQVVALPTSASSTQASSLLQRSLVVLVGNTSVSDVTLSGTARRIAGSDDETGTVTVREVSGGSSRIDMSLSSGPRSETRSVSSSGPTGSWSGPDNVAHSVAYHNVVTEVGLFPLFTLASIASSPNSVVTLVGQETRNDQSVIHLVASQQFPALTGNAAMLMQHLSQQDIYLDASTSLPAAIVFNIHPDNNALLDIPVELHFSDYRAVSGTQIPFHIQKFINNSLALDLQFQNVALNTGLTSAQVGSR